VKNKAGFSLIEFIMVMVILGVIMAIGVPLVMQATEAWVFQSQRKEMSESAKVAIGRMVREIRLVRNKTSVATASSATFRFTDTDNRDITFGSSGASLQRTEDGSVNTLADNLSSLSFVYYDSGGATIATPLVSPDSTNIRRVEINLVFSLGGTILSFQSQVSPRRLR